jgi:DNA-binding PadR family transcriptional regulator
VSAHGELFTDLKKGNVYYLLERLAQAGALQVTAEPGARGPRRERLVYTLTDEGRLRFHELLRAVVRTYEVAHSGVEVGMIFLPYLEPQEIVSLLEARRQAVLARRDVVERQAAAAGHLHEHLAQDHLLAMMDAELAWIARVLQHLRDHQGEVPSPQSSQTATSPSCSGAGAGDQT